jgi:hypothetical protein
MSEVSLPIMDSRKYDSANYIHDSDDYQTLALNLLIQAGGEKRRLTHSQRHAGMNPQAPPERLSTTKQDYGPSFRSHRFDCQMKEKMLKAILSPSKVTVYL